MFFQCFLGFRRSKLGAKTEQNSIQNCIKNGKHLGIDFAYLLVPSWVDFGAQNPWKIDAESLPRGIKVLIDFWIDFWWFLNAFWWPTCFQLGAQDAPGRRQEPPRRRQKSRKNGAPTPRRSRDRFGCDFGWILGRIWGNFGWILDEILKGFRWFLIGFWRPRRIEISLKLLNARSERASAASDASGALEMFQDVDRRFH